MKTHKIALITLAFLLFASIANALSSTSSEQDFVTIEMIDDSDICISLSPHQVNILYNILPDQYRDMLRQSYLEFRKGATGTDIFNVDGIGIKRHETQYGDIYVMIGSVLGFGQHKVQVNVGSVQNFMSVMDTIFLE